MTDEIAEPVVIEMMWRMGVALEYRWDDEPPDKWTALDSYYPDALLDYEDPHWGKCHFRPVTTA